MRAALALLLVLALAGCGAAADSTAETCQRLVDGELSTDEGDLSGRGAESARLIRDAADDAGNDELAEALYTMADLSEIDPEMDAEIDEAFGMFGELLAATMVISEQCEAAGVPMGSGGQ